MELMLGILSGNMDESKVDFSVNRKDFVKFWKGAREGTSSSPIRQHFEHYKAAVGCRLLEEVHSVVCNIVCRMATPLSR